jgi:hypothetical protein
MSDMLQLVGVLIRQAKACRTHEDSATVAKRKMKFDSYLKVLYAAVEFLEDDGVRCNLL